jgi:hypothetical protein
MGMLKRMLKRSKKQAQNRGQLFRLEDYNRPQKITEPAAS